MNSKELKVKYPISLRNVYCGIDIGQGWYNIVEPIISRLEEINGSLPEGEIIEVHQIKEKFGTLRFYTGITPKRYFKEINKIIMEAESKSSITCETCGDPGVLREGGWVKTLCDTHSEGKKPFVLPRHLTWDD